MQAIVFADRTGGDLAPLNQYAVPALLPVAGKTVLEHTLESLNPLGITEVFLVVGEQAAEIRRQFDDGARWSLRLTYVLSRDWESPDQVRHRIGERLQAPYLALRGDLLRSDLAEAAADLVWPKTPGSAARSWRVVSGQCLALMQVFCEPVSLDPQLCWPRDDDDPEVTSEPSLFCTDQVTLVSRLESLPAYHEAALRAVANDVGLRPSGMLQAQGLRVGAEATIHPRCLKTGAAWVGAFSDVHDDARLSGEVQIGQHCVIDHAAQLHNVLVLDNSYIGAGISVENAIVWGNKLIQLGHGSTLEISDSFILAPVLPGRRHGLHPLWIGQLLALLLLLASLPFWPLAALISALNGRGWRPSPLPGDAKPTLYSWPLPYPLLARLPLLAAVIRGRLALFGRPTGPVRHEQHAWSKIYRALPQGLFSPSDRLPAGAGDDARELYDIEQMESHPGLKLLMLLPLVLLALVRNRRAEAVAPAETCESAREGSRAVSR